MAAWRQAIDRLLAIACRGGMGHRSRAAVNLGRGAVQENPAENREALRRRTKGVVPAVGRVMPADAIYIPPADWST